MHLLNKTDTWTKYIHCPKRTGHVMHNKMPLRAKQFGDLLISCTLFNYQEVGVVRGRGVGIVHWLVHQQA